MNPNNQGERVEAAAEPNATSESRELATGPERGGVTRLGSPQREIQPMDVDDDAWMTAGMSPTPCPKVKLTTETDATELIVIAAKAGAREGAQIGASMALTGPAGTEHIITNVVSKSFHDYAKQIGDEKVYVTNAAAIALLKGLLPSLLPENFEIKENVLIKELIEEKGAEPERIVGNINCQFGRLRRDLAAERAAI